MVPGGIVGELAEMADIGNGLLSGKAFGVITILDGKTWHRDSSSFPGLLHLPRATSFRCHGPADFQMALLPR
jgi:hypothetical protein